MTHIKKHIYLYCLLLITLFGGLIAQNNLKKTDAFNTPFVADIDQYYSILPSTFLYADIGYAYDTAGHWNQYYEVGTFGQRYWTTEYQKSRRMTMATLGLPYAYSLFFIPAALVESFRNSDEYAPGYSPTYVLFAKIYGLALALIAVLIFYKIAERYTNKLYSALLSLLLFFGSGTFYYFFGEGLMPHATLTVLMATFILYSLRLLQDAKYSYLPILAFLITWIGLIRPTDALVVLFPLMLLLKKEARQYFIASLKSPKRILFSLVLITLLILPQILYWKYITGSYILYSYKDEGFHFNQWHLFDFWFSARKGWFVYSPICLLALLIPFIRLNKIKLETASVIIICLVLSLIYAQWWCWWYGGSFGMRTMTQFVPLLIIPLAILSTMKKAIKGSLIMLMIVMVYNNIRLSRSYHLGNIHYDSMSAKTLKQVYLNKEKPFDYYGQLVVPDYKGARRNGKEYEHKNVIIENDFKSQEEYIGGLNTVINSNQGYLSAKVYHKKNMDNVAAVLKVYDNTGSQVFYKQQFFNQSSFSKKGEGFNMMEFKFEKTDLDNYKAVLFIHNPDKKIVSVNKLELCVY